MSRLYDFLTLNQTNSEFLLTIEPFTAHRVSKQPVTFVEENKSNDPTVTCVIGVTFEKTLYFSTTKKEVLPMNL